MYHNPLQTFVLGITMVAGLSLGACDGSKTETAEELSSSSSTDAPSLDTQSEGAPSKGKVVKDLDGAVVAAGEPVKYDIAAWNAADTRVEPINITELDAIKATFGKVTSTDENSLDYASNPASKYRFLAADSPYLDLIDSEKYLELGWYYANPADSDKEKQLSQEHAKKAYKLSRQLMGDEGGKILADMLNGQIIKNQTAGGQKVELAKCEFYSCMLIINKAGAQNNDS